MLTRARKLKLKEFILRVGNRESALAEAVREARLVFGNKYLLLNNVYFILNFRRNLISISELYKKSFVICFNDNEILILGNSV